MRTSPARDVEAGEQCAGRARDRGRVLDHAHVDLVRLERVRHRLGGALQPPLVAASGAPRPRAGRCARAPSRRGPASASTVRSSSRPERLRLVQRRDDERSERAPDLAAHRAARSRTRRGRPPTRHARAPRPSAACIEAPELGRGLPRLDARAAGAAWPRTSRSIVASSAHRRPLVRVPGGEPALRAGAPRPGTKATADTGSTARTWRTTRASGALAPRGGRWGCGRGRLRKRAGVGRHRDWTPARVHHRCGRAVSPAAGLRRSRARRALPPARRAAAPVPHDQPDHADHDRGRDRVVEVVEAVLPVLPVVAGLLADEGEHQHPRDAAQRT